MRRRLVLAIAIVAAAAVALFALPLAAALQRSYRQQELLRLQRDTVAAARSIDLSRSSGLDQVELPAGADRLAVYDGAGRRVAQTPSAGPPRADAVVADAVRTRRPTARTPAGSLVVAVPLLTGERVSGAIRAQRADGVVTRRAHRAWLAVAAAAAIVIALAILAALLLGRRLARPLERVAVAAARLGDGDFSVRAPRGGIAEVDAVAEALDATAARLDDLITRERAFSADASHQLRTPLAALRLELEALELRGAGEPEVGHALAQVDRLQRTIDTLLAVARDAPRRRAQCDLVALVDDARGDWSALLAPAARPLRVSVTSPVAAVAADPAIVSEILSVLVENARQHGAGAVTIAVRDLGTGIALDVGDEGPGFPDGVAGEVFERGTGTGHGIGLPLARSLALAEGGQLDVTRAGARPVVTLLLPRSVAGD